MLQEKAQLQESLGEVYPWVQCEDPRVGMFLLFVRNGEGHLQVQKVGGRQGELLTGTMPQNYWNSIVDLNGTKTHQSLQEWLSM